MIFSSLQFLIFWLFAFLISRYKKFNSPIFIGCIGLIFYSFQGIFNFFILLYVFLITSIYSKAQKNLYFFIILILLPLIIIKYLNFILEDLLKLNFEVALIDGLIIPPGLSFISFSAIALIIYLRNNSESIKTNLAYLYLFPQLIAGPIVEPKSLIPQIKNKNLVLFDDIFTGIFIFSVGIGIKVLLADSIGNYIDPIFSDLENYEFKKRVVALFLFSQQIFFDFNGYTLMAIGVAKTLGINLPENFNAPYLSKSVSEFWKKWHITLSNWIKNYIYIPLGGSKSGKFKHYINIFIAMLISGIWHGAGYNFILWGFFHAIFIFFEKIFYINYSSNFFKVLKIIYCYLVVTFLWLLFRVNNIEDIISFFNDFSILNFLETNTLYFMAIIFILNYSQKYITINSLTNVYNRLNKIFVISLSSILIITCIVLSKGTSQKFIYFNF